MPEGLRYALSSKLSEGPRTSVVAYEEGPSMFLQSYIEEVLTNCLESAEGGSGKFHIHFISLVVDANCLKLLLANRDSVSIYDLIRNSCDTIEELYEKLLRNVASRPGRAHLIIIDDLATFSVLTCGRNLQKLTRFLSLVGKQFRKLFIFFHKDTLSPEEVGVLYDKATDIAFLQPHPESYGGGISSSRNKFICDLLKLRVDRKTNHDRSVLQIINGEIKEEIATDSVSKGGNSEADVLKSLTTFKLTIEDDERESKNKLHLPYFEAQKTSLEDPENLDDYDEDEEDEEI